MRIALVTGGLHLGGTTTFALYLGSGLKQLGVPVEVFSFTSVHLLRTEFDNAGLAVHLSDDQRFIFEDRLQQVYHRIRAFRPTAVIAVLGTDAYELLGYVPPGVLRIGTIHDRIMQPEAVVHHYRGLLDHMIVIAEYLREDLRRCDPTLPCTYLRHGVRLRRDLPSRDPNPDRPLRLIYYGRFDEASKQVRIFPRIAEELTRRRVPFLWTIHGSGPEQSFLHEHLDAYVRRGEVVFSNPVGLAELASLIRGHDIYLLTSAHEGGPLTLLESMSFGLVPVCGDIPCLIQEVLNGQNGFRVPFDDPAAYADRIAALHADRPLLERVSKAAYETIVTSFSEAAMARRYVDLLQSLAPNPAEVPWPGRIAVRPVITARGSILYQPFLRPVRRLLRRLQSRSVRR